jgi:recombination protein RecT
MPDKTNGSASKEIATVAKVPAKAEDIRSVTDLRTFLATKWKQQITNFFDDESQALRFLSGVIADVEKRPELMQCKPNTLINSYLTMAQLRLMPSGVSGEAFVLPYSSSSGMVAQFQLGYQGIVTLLYRAGVESIRSEIVREHDSFSYVNGAVTHSIDITKSNKARGKAVAAYAIAIVNGHEVAKAMNAEDIVGIGKKFSKSFNSKFTPWNEEQDPELWMWKKTVLKQLAKLLPKNEEIFKSIAEDNEDSIISDRAKMESLVETSKLTMGTFEKEPEQPAPELPEPNPQAV